MSWQVFKLGLAKSIHHARVLIRQRHIRVRKQVVNVPSFIVRLDSQKHIDFSLKSPFGGGRSVAFLQYFRRVMGNWCVNFFTWTSLLPSRPGRVKRRNAKKGDKGGDEEED